MQSSVRVAAGSFHLALAAASSDVKLWPMRSSVCFGRGSLHLSSDFGLLTSYTDASGILTDGFSRMVALLKADHVPDHSSAGSNPSVLRALRVVISSPSDEVQYGIDESYKLTVPSFHNPAHVHLQAETVYGALHGL